MIFKSVSSVTWSAVLVNRFDGQGNRNHLLKMSFRDILWISIIYAASVLSFITEKLEPPQRTSSQMSSLFDSRRISH